MTARDVIGRAIHEHDANACMGGVPWPTWDELDSEGRAAYEPVADRILAALAAAGFAVVHLPEPDHRCDRDAAWIVSEDEIQVDYDARGPSICVSYPDGIDIPIYGPWDTHTALTVGAALLAAHAERGGQR